LAPTFSGSACGAWESFCFSESGFPEKGHVFQAGSGKWMSFVNRVLGAPYSFSVKLFHGWALKCFLSVRLFFGHRAGTVCLLREAVIAVRFSVALKKDCFAGGAQANGSSSVGS